jgi:hypothetical protein
MLKLCVTSWALHKQVCHYQTLHKLQGYQKPHVPMLSFFLGAVAIYTFPGGTGAIHLDDIHCTGRESRLIDCPHSGVGVHNCIHFEDAGVRCVRPCMLIRNAVMIS